VIFWHTRAFSYFRYNVLAAYYKGSFLVTAIHSEITKKIIILIPRFLRLTFDCYCNFCYKNFLLELFLSEYVLVHINKILWLFVTLFIALFVHFVVPRINVVWIRLSRLPNKSLITYVSKFGWFEQQKVFFIKTNQEFEIIYKFEQSVLTTFGITKISFFCPLSFCVSLLRCHVLTQCFFLMFVLHRGAERRKKTSAKLPKSVELFFLCKHQGTDQILTFLQL
jgi:hypothetical protein